MRDRSSAAGGEATSGALNAAPIEVFNPVRDNALGRYMYSDSPDFPDLNNLVASVPNVLPGYAYGPYILNQYTQYDPTDDIATIFYLMSTGKPYQVQVMRSSISGLRRKRRGRRWSRRPTRYLNIRARSSRERNGST